MGIPGALGIGSGLQLGSLLEQLAQSEQKRLIPLKTQQASYQAELTAYGRLQGALDGLMSATKALGEASLYSAVEISSEAESFTATASSKAVTGHYQIDINQLARAQSLVSTAQASKTDTTGDGGTFTLKLGDGTGNVSSSVTINIDAEDSSLVGIRDAINAADIGVNASIIDDGSGDRYHLVLSSQKTGTDQQISVQVNATSGPLLTNVLGYDSVNDTGVMTQTVDARNAELTINGIAIQSQSNVVEDAIQGVTLTLTGTTPDGAEALDATRDLGAIKDALKEFVSSYNSYQKIESDLTAYNGPEKSSGILIGDSATRRVENRIRRALNTPIQGSEYFSLAQIGITVQLDGTMEIDSDKLDEALKTNLGEIKSLLSGTETTKGISGVLTNTLKELAGENGLLTNVTDGIETSMERIQERAKDMQESINASVARYRQQFQQLDIMMAQLNSTKAYLSQQLATLNNDDE